MASATKLKLSGSTNGRGIKVTQTTSGSADTLHTATSTAGEIDEIYLEACNMDTTSRVLTICWGGTSDPDDLISLTLRPKQGLVMIVPGNVLAGGLVAAAYADVANKVIVHGFVNRIVN